jgi:hypothetical protein
VVNFCVLWVCLFGVCGVMFVFACGGLFVSGLRVFVMCVLCGECGVGVFVCVGFVCVLVVRVCAVCLCVCC